MSYLVMARRWRPQRFADVVGQEHVTRTLQRAIARGRVAHAYLFTGPRGVGKTTTARLLAMAVNDPELIDSGDGLPELDPDREQNRDIAAGSALDVIEIDGASNNKVEDVRQLRESIKYAPTSLAKKVYVIDEVHMLSQAAFNALLKTLEEPPDHAMFIFATTEAHKVPATVLSRCQRYDFKRIPTKQIREQLVKIVEADELAIDDDALTAISVKADGALRDALSILDQLVAYQGGERITEQVVRQALGLIGGEIYFRTTDLAASGDVSAALAVARDLTSGGHDPREFLRGLQQHVLRYLFLKAGGTADELTVTEEERARYADTLANLDDEDLLRIGEWASEAEDLLRDALDPVLRLELLLVRIAKMDRAVELGALLQRMGVEPDSFRTPRRRPQGPAAGATSAENGPGPGGGASGRGPEHGPERAPAGGTGAGGAGGEEEPGRASAAKQQPGPVAVLDETDEPDEARPGSDSDTVAANGTSRERVNGADRAASPADHAAGEPEAAEQGETDTPEAESPNAPAAETGPGSGSDPRELDEEEPPAGDEPGITLVQVREAWLDFCDSVEDGRRLLGSHLERGAPTSLEDGSLEVTFEPACAFEFENVFKHRDEIGRAFRSQFGESRRIVVKKGTVPESLRPAKRPSEHEQRRQRFEQLLEQNPVWKQMVERFELK